MLSTKGFSLLELMAAVSIVAGVGLAVFRLQLIELAISQQSLTKQAVVQSANSLANQIYALGLTGSARGLLAETWYSDDSQAPSYSCAGSPIQHECNASAYAKFILYQWKSALAGLKLQGVVGIVCLDNDNYAKHLPTASSANCDAAGKNLVIKLRWLLHPAPNESAQFGQSDSYILRVPQQ